MDLHLLGPVEAILDGRQVPLGATKQRAVLAMLALQPNATVSVDRLVDGLWGEKPPATAAKMVQLYVSQLRRLLAGDGAQIVTHGRGYELRLPAEAVDAVRFERLVEQASGPDHASGDSAHEALALWHGGALADVAGEPFAAAEIRRLDELWLRAAELAVDGELASGHDSEALAQVERLIDEYPLRERLHAQRMLALYRSGRQADALEAYAAARRRLVDEVGVEPSGELRELQARILRQDPSLEVRPAPVETRHANGALPAPSRSSPGRSTARHRLVLAAAAAVILALAVFAATRLFGADRLSGIDAPAVGVIDPKAAAITTQYRIGSEPGAVAAGAGSVWVASPRDGTVSRLHRDEDRLETIDVGPAPVALAFGAGSLWVAGGEDGAVAQVDPATNRVEQRIPVGNGLRAVAVGNGALWAATALDGDIVRIDLRSGRQRRIAIGGQPAALATGAGAVWVAAEESGTVAHIDARTGEILAGIAVGNGPSALAVGLGAVWTANREDGTVSRIDPAHDRVTETMPAGRAPAALAIADGALWVGDASGAVLRLDPRTRRIAHTVRTGSTPAGLATAGGSIWVTAVAPPAAHRGGTLRVGGQILQDPASFSPDAVPVIGLAYDSLLGYRRVGGAAGARLVGDLAVGIPKPADGGRRYVFRLRRGLRYSDGTRLKAGDVRPSVERVIAASGDVLAPIVDSIEGGPGCGAAPRRCDLSRGITSDEQAGTVTIRLRRPDPDLLPNLGFFAVVPADTPRRPLRVHLPPGTGPYRVESLVPLRRGVLTRNPYFRPRGPDAPTGFADRIEIAMKPGDHIAAVERGQLDLAYVFEATSGRIAALRTRIGARLRSAPHPFTEFAWLNVKEPPFDDLRVRRALNLAVNRRRVVSLTGGPDMGSPTCQVLPPGLPGYRPTCAFTAAPSPAGAWTAPDQERAKRLVAASGTRGTAVEVWGFTPRRTVARYLAHVLRELGYRTTVRIDDNLGPLQGPRDPRRHAQVGPGGWLADSPEPGPFLRALISCGSSFNLSRFCDPGIDAAIDRAQAAGPEAGAEWQRIERRIARRAPVVPLTTRRWVEVTSKRAGNVQIHPIYGPLLDQVWVR